MVIDQDLLVRSVRLFANNIRSIVAITLSSVFAFAYAQEATKNSTKVMNGDPAVATSTVLSEVVVTGSRISRPDYVADSPIVTTDRKAIENSGAVTIESALNQLPQFTPSTGAATVFPNKGGQANINLRGLGTNRALVLLNGRRIQPSNPDGTIDTNLIPVSLIDSIETITGGASAAYGSDAMAGVVNFKLKNNFTGMQVDGQTGISTHGDGGYQQASGLFGTDFADDRGNVTVSLDYAHRTSVKRADRDFSKTSLLLTYLPLAQADLSTNSPSQPAINSVFGTYGIGAPGRITIFGLNADGSLFKEAPATSAVLNYRGDLNNILQNSNNSIVYNAGSTYNLQTPLTRYNLYSSANYELTENTKLYGQVLATQYDSTAETSQATVPGTGVVITAPVTNPFIPADLRTILASRPSPNAAFPVRFIVDQLGPQHYEVRWKVYQFLGGFSGNIPSTNLSYDIYASIGRTENTEARSHYAISSAIQTFLNAPGGGALSTDPVQCQGGFNIFTTRFSNDCAAKVLSTIINKQSIDQRVAEANLQGNLFELPAGTLKFAAGAAYRSGSYSYRPDGLLQVGDTASGGTVLPASGSTNVSEAYGELLLPLLHNLPLIKSLDADLAYRYSDYSSVGGVKTYKADINWAVFDSLRLRGGYSRGVRAPALSELYAANNILAFAIGAPAATAPTGDPCDVRSSFRTGPNAAAVQSLCLAQGVPAAALSNYTYSSTTIYGTNTGNPNLKAETADTYSAGFVWKPVFSNPLVSKLQASVDYYNISIKDAIGQLSLISALQLCFNSDGAANPSYSQSNNYCSQLRRDSATGNLSSSIAPTYNLASYKTAGVDVQVDWGLNLADFGLPQGAGSLNFNVLTSFLENFKIKSFPTAPELNYAGSTSGVVANVTPKFKSVVSATYSVGTVGITARWRHIDSLIDASLVTTPTSTVKGVPAYDYLDLSGRVKVGKGLEFRGGINNVANRKPPQVGSSIGITDPGTYDVIGRTFYVAARANF